MINIYLANLAEYNAGRLRGKWVELPCDCLEGELQEIGCMDEDEEIIAEWAIHDYESDIPNFSVDEYDDIYKLNDIAEEYDGLAYYDQKTVEAHIEATGDSLEDTLKRYGDDVFYEGVDTLAELAEQFVDEGLFGDIPNGIANYIDYEAIGRDLGFEGYYEVSNGVIYTG